MNQFLYKNRFILVKKNKNKNKNGRKSRNMSHLSKFNGL